MFELRDGTEMSLRGTITTFSADNKAAWGIAGFKDLGRAFRRCQYCLAVDEDLQTKVLYMCCHVVLKCYMEVKGTKLVVSNL